MRILIRARRRAGVVLSIGLVLSTGACDGLLDVKNPGSVEAGDLDNPALASTLVASAIGHFECAYTTYVATAGMLSNEYVNASGFAALNPWGWRGLEINTIAGTCVTSRTASNLGAFAAVQQARYLSEEAARLIEVFPAERLSNKSEMLGLLAAYSGFSYVLLSEGFCEVTVDGGPLMTRQAAAALAEERFDQAVTHADAAGNADLRLLAIAGRARTRLNMGNVDGAASDAAQIPPGFRWDAEYSTVDPSRENRLYNMNHHAKVMSVNPVDYGPDDGNAMLGGSHDPRLPMENSGETGHDGATELWYQLKFPAADSPIPMASWEEAQLIIAEARPAEAEAAINRLRSSQGLPAYVPSGDVLADVVEERRRQLFSEGHRLNDMLRHDIPFPAGFNHKGQAWGPITCMPIPDQERQNNPNID